MIDYDSKIKSCFYDITFKCDKHPKFICEKCEKVPNNMNCWFHIVARELRIQYNSKV